VTLFRYQLQHGHVARMGYEEYTISVVVLERTAKMDLEKMFECVD